MHALLGIPILISLIFASIISVNADPSILPTEFVRYTLLESTVLRNTTTSMGWCRMYFERDICQMSSFPKWVSCKQCRQWCSSNLLSIRLPKRRACIPTRMSYLYYANLKGVPLDLSVRFTCGDSKTQIGLFSKLQISCCSIGVLGCMEVPFGARAC